MQIETKCKTVLHEFTDTREGLTLNPYVGCSHRCACCVTPGTQILTLEGLKAARETQIGDRVLTHVGHFRTVRKVVCHEYSGEVVGLRPQHVNVPIRVTPGQPVLIGNGKNGVWKRARSWRKGDLLLFRFPRHQRAIPSFPFPKKWGNTHGAS